MRWAGFAGCERQAKFELKIYQLHIALCLHRRHGFPPLSLHRLAECGTTKDFIKEGFQATCSEKRENFPSLPPTASVMCLKLILNYISIHPDCVRFPPPFHPLFSPSTSSIIIIFIYKAFRLAVKFLAIYFIRLFALRIRSLLFRREARNALGSRSGEKLSGRGTIKKYFCAANSKHFTISRRKASTFIARKRKKLYDAHFRLSSGFGWPSARIKFSAVWWIFPLWRRRHMFAFSWDFKQIERHKHWIIESIFRVWLLCFEQTPIGRPEV